MKSYYILVSILVLIGCKGNPDQNEINYDPEFIPDEIVSDSSVDYSDCDTILFTKGDQVISLDSIILSIRLIKLETNNECLVGSVQKVIVRNDKYYIFDSFRAKNAVHVFDTIGKHIGTIRKTGRGPGEYKDIMDVDVDEEGNIYILNTIGGNIIVYDAMLNFVRSINPPIYLTSFCLFRESIIGMVDRTGFRNTGMNLLYILNMDGSIRKSHFPFEQLAGNGAAVQTHLVRYNNEVFINLPFSETIFSMDSLFSLKARYHLIYYSKGEDGEVVNLFHTQDMKNFFQSDSFLYAETGTNPIIPCFSNVDSAYRNKVTYTKLSTGDLNPFPIDGILDGNIAITVFPVSFFLNSLSIDGLVGYYDSNKVFHQKKDPQRVGSDTLPGSLYDQVRKMNENDNPVIILTKLKPF